MPAPVAVILMGVTGCGKTTVGRELANRLGCQFHDGDDFHPAANIEKMRRGQPLNDEDRAPWLARLRQALEEKLRSGEYVVLACSALRESYRGALLPVDPAIGQRMRFVYLKISPECARERLKARTEHFMPASMVESQFATLEEPENAVVLDGTMRPEVLAEKALAALN